jgi:HAD superfamily hydrolase (TIGR01509 family)
MTATVGHTRIPLGLVFDLDGTLVDSQLDFAGMRSGTGCPEETGLLEFVESLPDPKAQRDALAVIHRYEMAGASLATWMPGAQSLLERLHSEPRPIAIFTRNSRETAQRVIANLGIPCDELIAREDAAAKPAPEGLLQLCQRWQLAAADLLSVGDFLYDLEAARAAGMPCCLYDPAGDSPFRDRADLVVTHFDQLAQHVIGEQ